MKFISLFVVCISSIYASGVVVMNEGTIPLEYDYYHSACPRAELIIRDRVSNFIKNDTRITPQLLRLLFHDCFIRGCDASVLLDDSKGNKSYQIEKDAFPNLTLKGFEKIETIKQALEAVCPGVVSCSDIIVMAVRDGIVLSGGPYYPVLTGRKDSLQSYHDEANDRIPRPDSNIDEILRLFRSIGFTVTEIVSLSGAHNIGTINCQFMQPRFENFQGAGHPDPSIPLDFLTQMQSKCGNISNLPLPSIESGNTLDSHYYESLMKGRGLMISDQQLMEDPHTAQVVRVFASDNGITFRREFVKSMVKMSDLGPLTGTQGEVRRVCSLPN